MRRTMLIGLGLTLAALVGCGDKEKERLTKREQDRLAYQLTDVERERDEAKAALRQAETDLEAARKRIAELKVDLDEARQQLVTRPTTPPATQPAAPR